MFSIETFNLISQQLNIYIGIILFIFGILGNLMNIVIFQHRSLRSNSSCIYMFTSSLASIVQICFGLIPRIVTEGFYYDWTLINMVWCKIRNYVTSCASLTALTCFIWLSIDRFCSTCRQLKWRYLNSAFLAKQICILTLISWMIVNFPILIYVQLDYTLHSCRATSIIWSKISVYFISLFCYGIFPWFFMSLFGLLTLKNLRRRINPLSRIVVTRITRLNTQLTSMLFLQILLAVLSSIPYCVQSIYNNLTQSIEKTPLRQAQEKLFLEIVRLAFYLNYAGTFYVNYLSSKIFRHLTKLILIHLCTNKRDASGEITIINHHYSRSRRRRNGTTVISTPII